MLSAIVRPNPVRVERVDPWNGGIEYFGGAANKIFGETIPVQDSGLDVTLREPVGVCALIVPWNFPVLIATWKIAPALTCGNTVVVKPASYTPLSVLMLAGSSLWLRVLAAVSFPLPRKPLLGLGPLPAPFYSMA